MKTLKLILIIIITQQFNGLKGQVLSLTSTPVGGGQFNVQASFSGNSSCEYNVIFSCPTCTPTSLSCTGVTNVSSCAVTFTMAPGSNPITATASYVSGSGPQCPSPLTASLTVLPIVMKKFELTKNRNTTNLLWVTSSETNNDYFTIERSVDGWNFESIGTLQGAGNSNHELSYVYIDENPASGSNYYRIKQTDFDGKYSYSVIRSVKFNESSVSILPRKTDGRLNIVTDRETYDLFVFNNTGQEVQSFTALSGSQSVQIDALQAGLYFIKVIYDGESETFHVVKY